MKHFDIIIIGGGVSGCFAAISTHNHYTTLIIEQNDVILKKFMLTGKGYSNIANTSPPHDFLKNLIDSNKFLYPALHEYDGQHLLGLLDRLKIAYYFKAPHRVHLRDSNASFRRKILQLMDQSSIQCAYQTKVLKITRQDAQFIVSTNHDTYSCQHLIVATGGLSYPTCGCHGDGYEFAQHFNLPLTPRYPIGVGVHCQCFDKSLQGTSMDDVQVTVHVNDKAIYSETGALMFTHYGLGGPVIRRVSGYLTKALMAHQSCAITLAFVNPTTFKTQITTHQHLTSAFATLPNKFLATHLQAWMDCDLANLKKTEHQALYQHLCHFHIPITATEDITYAINTGGGVALKALNPNTYESHIPHLYFIGEVLDLNPRTNGFNITTCYATANKCMAAIAQKMSRHQ